MALFTNRLDFDNMVEQKLQRSHSNETATYFDAVTVAGGAKKPTIKKLPAQNKPTKISSSVNSIMTTVHNRLNKYNPKKYSPSIPPVIAEIGTEAVGAAQPKVVLVKKSTSNVPPLQKVQQVKANLDNNLKTLSSLKPKTIPQAHAAWEQKCHMRMRRAIGKPTDMNNFTSQQRIREVLRQKRMLEEMLEEHKKLQRNRQTIAAEIQQMKNYLSEIGGKLDYSLKKLNTKQPTFEDFRPRLSTCKKMGSSPIIRKSKNLQCRTAQYWNIKPTQNNNKPHRSKVAAVRNCSNVAPQCSSLKRRNVQRKIPLDPRLKTD